jgi:hypothetical protein
VGWVTTSSGTTADLRDVWSLGPCDAWAVGKSGTVLHWNGQAWAPVASGTSADLTSVWGAAPDDVWAGGDDGLLHWDGTSWSAVTGIDLPNITDIWGSGPSQVWAGGGVQNGDPNLTVTPFILEWNGQTWQPVPEAKFQLSGSNVGFHKVCPMAHDDGWAFRFGVVGRVFRWDGIGWTKGPPDWPTSGGGVGAGPYLDGAWCNGPNDLWMSGHSSGAVFFHWDGLSWTSSQASSLSATASPSELWGSGPDDVWAVDRYPPFDLYHWDGSGWISEPNPAGEKVSFGGSSDHDVWAVGGGGTILHFQR